MSFLVRKINKAKWFQVDIINDDDASADAITNCLKTTRNTLSVWRIENEVDLDIAILAIVSNQDHLDTIDVIILEEVSIAQYNIKIIASPGDTPVDSLIEAHRDLEGLTFNKMGNIKDCIIQRIRSDKLKRYTVASLRKILTNAIANGELKKEDLKESLRNKL